jgi:hypothetical protein
VLEAIHCFPKGEGRRPESQRRCRILDSRRLFPPTLTDNDKPTMHIFSCRHVGIFASHYHYMFVNDMDSTNYPPHIILEHCAIVSRPRFISLCTLLPAMSKKLRRKRGTIRTAMVRLMLIGGAASSACYATSFSEEGNMMAKIPFTQRAPAPEKAPQLPRELPPVNKPGGPILVPRRPRAALQPDWRRPFRRSH